MNNTDVPRLLAESVNGTQSIMGYNNNNNNNSNSTGSNYTGNDSWNGSQASFGGEALYAFFGLVWVCVLYQLAQMYRANQEQERERRQQHQATQEQKQQTDLEDMEQRRTRMKEHFQRQNVLLVSLLSSWLSLRCLISF